MKNRSLRTIPQKHCDEKECLNSIHKKPSESLPFFKLIEKNKTKNYIKNQKFIKKEKFCKKSRIYDNLKKNKNNISNHDKNYSKCIEILIKERSIHLKTIKTNQNLIDKLYKELKRINNT
ncbi:hypothetical protein GVAV_002180 [Gurleya vavrai]